MSATFLEDLSRTTDWLRAMVSDTDMTTPIYQDETYSGFLAAAKNNPLEALAQVASALIIYYQQEASFVKDDDTSEDYTQRIKALQDLRDDARSGRIQAPGMPSNTGGAVATIIEGQCNRGFRPF